MWVMTSFGILMPSLRPAHTIDPGDNQVLQIRTRRRQELDILRAQYMGDQLGPVIYMKDTDYEYRAYCTRAAWARAMADMSLDIDYTKFKPTTETKYRDFQLHRLYNEMWGIIQRHLSNRQRVWEYWHPKRRKNKRGSRTLTTEDFEQLLRAEEYEDDWKLFDDIDTSDVDQLTEGPDMRPDGSLDHSTCDHAPSNAARKRCRRRWVKNHK